MTDSKTPDTLIAAGRELFPALGYDGTSIRAITQRAGANLGAVTYHFGSKAALYDAVIASLGVPFQRRVAEVAATPGSALMRIESIVVAVFEHLAANPALPRMMIQLLASARPLPDSARQVLEGNHRVVSELITEGQRDGTVRQGEVGLLAISVVAQPIWFTLVRDFLAQATAIDQSDPVVAQRVVAAAVRFVRAGLAPRPENSQ